MDKKITIYDIARETGFSVGTVNRALSGKTRISPATKKLILETADKMGYKANAAAQGLRRSPINIGAILFCPIEEYVDSIIEGICSSGTELEKYNVRVDVKKLDYTNGKDCIEKTIRQINTFVENNYNGIILFMSSMIDEFEELTCLINNLTNKNIFFATVANDIPQSSRVLHVGIDAFTAGKMAAEMLELSCRGEDVALLVTSTSSPVNMEYIKGFQEYAKDDVFSSIKIYEHYDDKDKIISATDLMLKENPCIKGVYMSTAGSTIACRHIKNTRNNGLYVITTDLLKGTPDLLKSKAASATIFQNPYKQGKTVVRKLYNYITRGEGPGIHLINPHILLSSNLDNYLFDENL